MLCFLQRCLWVRTALVVVLWWLLQFLLTMRCRVVQLLRTPVGTSPRDSFGRQRLWLPRPVAPARTWAQFLCQQRGHQRLLPQPPLVLLQMWCLLMRSWDWTIRRDLVQLLT